MQVIKKSQLNTSTWAGGTTTQLAIFPATASYQALNFDWRLSTATVALAESPFTKLPGISRHIMVLKGDLSLKIEGGDALALSVLEPYSFDGGLQVVSLSKTATPEVPVVDFNLMTRGQCSGQLEAFTLSGEVTLANIGDTMALYVVSGEVGVQSQDLDPGDLVLLDSPAITLYGEAVLVLAYITQ